MTARLTGQDAGQLWNLLEYWPDEVPLCLFGLPPDYSVLALSGSEVSPAILEERCLVEDRVRRNSAALPFGQGYMGVLSYADYGEKGARRNSFVYQVRSALVFDHRKNQVWLTGDPDARDVTFRMELSELPSGGGGLRGGGSSSLSLQPDESDEHYLERVSQALEEIRDGRYYQINLLRYFRLQDPGRLNLLRRLCRHGGPAGAWFRQGERELLSFSPERFVSFRAEGDLVRLETRPVKGTAPRHRDEEEDRQARNDLLNSRKDRAELSMIIDLMRNDLHRVCEPGSVQVEEPGRVYSWSTLHHLAGRITGRARHDLTMGRLFRDLCPAGSITGAPKVEVMQAIAESEGRSRGCFMGNAFCWDPGAGIFDSSVLIRTMVRRSAEAWEWAAGSGIVIGSDPQLERDEIWVKCRVLTDKV